jgi:Kdo2-lipid IVA lauroyltransferase/acyltransferase
MSAPQAEAAPRGLELWRTAWREAPTAGRAIRYFLEYLAMRLWGVLISPFPIETNLATARLLGRLWWWLMPKHRERALENLRHAFPDLSDAQRILIGRRSLEHFAQVYLVELVSTPRLVNEWSWARYVELGDVGLALRTLLGDRGVILITAHFGNFELLGYTLARLGIPLVAVMRPLDDPLLNDYLMKSRQPGGLTLLFKHGVSERALQVLTEHGALCFISDQDAGRKGVFAEFFGRQASWYKSIGLLALHQRVPIIVGNAARTRQGFRYRISVERIIQPEEWEAQADPLRWVTQTYAHALEAAIRRHPEQYLWMHRRWKHRPRAERQAASVESAD